MIPQQTTNYLLAALRSLTAHHPRTTQRLNPKKSPRVDPTDPSVARAVGYEERPTEIDAIRNWPPNMCMSDSGVWLLSFCTCITHLGQPLPRIWFLFPLWGLEDMLSSPLGPHILSYETPHVFVMPSFAMYDGSTYLYDHMLHFNQTMILSAGNDRLLCKVFPASLKGYALA